jgi:adenine deaminase
LRTDLIKAARGDAPADLVLTNCRLINVYTGEIHQAEVAIHGELIAAVGRSLQPVEASETLDLGGRYLCPGFVNAHVHVESSMVIPTEFARAVVPRGTTTAVADPHEIANVCGMAGIRYMLDVAEHAPMTILANAPSCVPATHMSTSGASLSAEDLAALLDHPRVPGLAEMMNYPGVILAVPEVMAKVEAYAKRPIDGHAPGLTGRELQAYVAAGIGSDHECVAAEEATEKLRLGMRILIREGTTARNLGALLPAVTPANARRCCFCTDDRHPADLLDEGDLDVLVRTAIAGGLEPITAIQMATLNTAEWFRLWDRGAVAPGKRADLVVFSDLSDLRAELIFVGGRLVARGGQMVVGRIPPGVDDSAVRNTVRLPALTGEELALDVPAGDRRVRVIGASGDQVVTGHLLMEPTVRGSEAVADPERDLLKMAVIERHRGTGNLGLGFVSGIGLRRGAIATTVCHDHHNLIVIGADDASMMTAVRAAAEMGGGEAVAVGDRVVQTLALPIAGLMSDRPLEQVRQQQDAMLGAAAELGCPLHDPFMTASFLALEVIPALKLTDQGLVDVERFGLVDLWVD